MNIRSTALAPKFSAPQAPKPQANLKQDFSFTPQEKVQITLRLPDNLGRRAIGTGLGSVATGVAASFLMGDLSTAGVVTALAVGGVAGALLSSDKAVGAYHQFKAQRAEQKAQVRLEKESASRAEELFQTRVNQAAQEQVEARWEKSGEGLVADQVEAQIAQRLQAQVGPKVEAQVGERIDQAVEVGVNEALTSRADEIEGKVSEQVESKVAERVAKEAAPKVEAALAERLEQVVRERTDVALKESNGEIESRVQALLDDHVAEQADEQIALRQKSAKHVGDLNIHYKLANAAANKKWGAGTEVFRDGFEILKTTSETLPVADKALMQLALESGDDFISPAIKKYSARSKFMAMKQTASVLQQTTEHKSAALDPKAYLGATSMKNNTWDSNRRLLKMGLEVMAKHGDLTPTEKMLCMKASDNQGMDYQAEHAHLKNVFKVLAGEEI